MGCCKLLVISFVLFGVLLCAEGQLNTGVKVRITKEGLNYGARIAVDQLAERLANSRLPDQSGNGFELQNIRITRFDKPAPDVALNAGSGLSANLNNAAITVEANWKYSVGKGWFKVRDSGRITLSSSRFSIGSSLVIGRDGNGRPTASAASCSCSIRDFDVKFHGGFSVIYNLFARLFENKIRNKLQDLTCEKIVELINTKVKDELSSLNVDAKIEDNIQLDYRLSENPVFTSDYLESSHVGEFFSANLRCPVPADPANFKMINPKKMVTISISDRLFNCGSYILQKLGKFNFSHDINAGEINDFLPFLPNEKLTFKLGASGPPSVKISPTDFTCNLSASLRLFSFNSDSTLHLLSSVQLGLVVRLDLSIEAEKIKGRFISIEPSVVHSNSSSLINLPASDVQQALQYIFALIMPSLNEEASNGFPMPQLDFVAFKESDIVKDDGILTVSTNVVANY